ncbi:two-component regulator propeller domain-containing protein [Spirosoma soli]|uniref:histidine kinase n=1 Tax=Spirosoma soli TaxID=1770529 RepID=A0ABW5M5I0_9BACT
MKIYLLLFLLILYNQGIAQLSDASKLVEVQAQNQRIDNQFEHLSVKDGLSNNSVNCILQDREGFMWFGTNDGLNKYDGYTFTALQPDANNVPGSFQNNLINGLCEDHTNRLWAATEGGLHEVNKLTGGVIYHPIRASNASLWNFQHAVYEDSQHVLWISTLGGLARYEPARRRFTLFPVPQPGATIKTVFEDRQHRFWVATLHGLYLFERRTGLFTSVPAGVGSGPEPTFISFYLDDQETLWLGTAGHGLFQLNLCRYPWQLVAYNPGGLINPFVYLNSLHKDAAGMIWVGTTSGLQRINPSAKQVYTYRPDPSALKGISSNNAQAVYHDRAGTLWVGTDNGIDRQGVTDKPFVTYQVRPNKSIANLPENKVHALLLDNNNQLWISSGYTVFRVQAGQTHPYAIPAHDLGTTSEHKNYTHSFLADGLKGVWIGTWNGLYHFNQISGQYKEYPSDIPAQFIDRSPLGDIWLGGDGGIASFNPHTGQYKYYKYKQSDTSGLPAKYIHGLLVSHTGDVWVLIRKQGVCRLNPKTGQFTRYTAGLGGGLSSNDVQAIHEDKKGMIWIGTNQGGLNRFDPQTGLFSAISIPGDMRRHNIVGITSDQAGYIWLSTSKGLCRFNPQTKVIRSYEIINGLPSNDFLQHAVFQKNNRLFFGTLNGLVHFNPDSIRDDTRPFPVYITGVNVLTKPRPITGNVLTLTHDENFISFEFAALTYVLSEQNQYAHQLIGVDKDWVQNGNRHFANYTNLPPGDYLFRVKAANSDGVWNETGASIRFLIQPPWWATWWAYGVYALLAGGAIWGYIRYYTSRVRQRQEMALNRREAQQLKAVDELKTRFFSNITHEFRTPLSLIIAPVEKLMQDRRFDPPTRQMLSLVRRNADQLLRLINQLLDLSKLEANSMAISLTQGKLIEFVDQLVESFQQVAEQKGVTLQYTAEQLAHQQLFDADKWEKILTNLLSNALKFTEAGGRVTLSLTPAYSSETREIVDVKIQIVDSGIGIAPANLPHIFDRFYQVDTSRTRAYEGTGIGLALTKELVGLLGGTITVESELKVGTTFTLILPVQSVSATAHTPKIVLPRWAPVTNIELTDTPPFVLASQSANESLTPRILIVEDNDELREFLVSELTAHYRVLPATNGEVGWQLAQSELPDLVISDVMMPRMDGYELTRLIKNQPDTDHIPVVLLTAKAAHHSRIEGLQQGADDYLAKPFHLDELLLRLRNLLAHQQKVRDQYRRQLTQPDMPSPLLVVQDAFLRQVYELLETHLKDPSLNVDWLADQLAMSRKTLYRKIHSLIQLSPNELIRQYRLRKAADLLRAGYNVSQTAYLVGFKTPAYFTIVFKEFYQKTPTEYIAAGLSQA